MVVKKGGQRESFDRYKILSGLRKACEKRPVSVLQMEDLAKSIEARLLELGENEVQSQLIGEMVIERLHDLDQVAYVRFASVYREFSDVQEFMEALRNLVSNNRAVGAVKDAFPTTASANGKSKKQKQQELAFLEKSEAE